ncbi:ABC transporter substrate-binding protein [Salicibibacter kimchii]|nr:ABC transporter substrate-binding protein [Salicibibacter kimchii]
MQNLIKRHLLSFIVLMLFIITGCSNDETTGSAQDTESQKVRVGFNANLDNFDPVHGSSGSDHALLYPVYDTLISFDEDLEPEPGLAESWEFTDNETLQLNLRDDVLFHDGTPFNAEAVKFNIDRGISEESPLSDLSSINGVEIMDELTVNLHLAEPDSSLVLALADRGGMMVSPTALEEGGDSYGQAAVGAGPFEVEEWSPNDRIVYTKFDGYWQDDHPKTDQLEVLIMQDEITRINALQNDEIDFAYRLPSGDIFSLENDPSIDIVESQAVPVHILYLNTSQSPFDNKSVRRAIQFGINREELSQAIDYGQGEGAYQPFPSDYWVYNEDLQDLYDPDKARSILEEEGLDNVSVSIGYNATAYYARAVDVLRQQLDDIGIQLNTEAMEITTATATYFDEQSVPALLSRWTGRPDPHMTMSLLFSEGSYYNTGSHTTEEINTLLNEAAAVTEDEDKRAEIYGEISRIAVEEEAIMIPLVFQPEVIGMHNDVKGYEGNLLGKPRFDLLWKES